MSGPRRLGNLTFNYNNGKPDSSNNHGNTIYKEDDDEEAMNNKSTYNCKIRRSNSNRLILDENNLQLLFKKVKNYSETENTDDRKEIQTINKEKDFEIDDKHSPVVHDNSNIEITTTHEQTETFFFNKDLLDFKKHRPEEEQVQNTIQLEDCNKMRESIHTKRPQKQTEIKASNSYNTNKEYRDGYSTESNLTDQKNKRLQEKLSNTRKSCMNEEPYSTYSKTQNSRKSQEPLVEYITEQKQSRHLSSNNDLTRQRPKERQHYTESKSQVPDNRGNKYNEMYFNEQRHDMIRYPSHEDFSKRYTTKDVRNIWKERTDEEEDKMKQNKEKDREDIPKTIIIDNNKKYSFLSYDANRDNMTPHKSDIHSENQIMSSSTCDYTVTNTERERALDLNVSSKSQCDRFSKTSMMYQSKCITPTKNKTGSIGSFIPVSVRERSQNINDTLYSNNEYSHNEFPSVSSIDVNSILSAENINNSENEIDLFLNTNLNVPERSSFETDFNKLSFIQKPKQQIIHENTTQQFRSEFVRKKQTSFLKKHMDRMEYENYGSSNIKNRRFESTTQHGFDDGYETGGTSIASSGSDVNSSTSSDLFVSSKNGLDLVSHDNNREYETSSTKVNKPSHHKARSLSNLHEILNLDADGRMPEPEEHKSRKEEEGVEDIKEGRKQIQSKLESLLKARVKSMTVSNKEKQRKSLQFPDPLLVNESPLVIEQQQQGTFSQPISQSQPYLIQSNQPNGIHINQSYTQHEIHQSVPLHLSQQQQQQQQQQYAQYSTISNPHEKGFNQSYDSIDGMNQSFPNEPEYAVPVKLQQLNTESSSTSRRSSIAQLSAGKEGADVNKKESMLNELRHAMFKRSRPASPEQESNDMNESVKNELPDDFYTTINRIDSVQVAENKAPLFNNYLQNGTNIQNGSKKYDSMNDTQNNPQQDYQNGIIQPYSTNNVMLSNQKYQNWDASKNNNHTLPPQQQNQQIDLFNSFPLPNNMTNNKTSINVTTDNIAEGFADEDPINRNAVMTMLKAHMKDRKGLSSVKENDKTYSRPKITSKSFSLLSTDIDFDYSNTPNVGLDDNSTDQTRTFSVASEKPEFDIFASSSFKTNIVPDNDDGIDTTNIEISDDILSQQQLHHQHQQQQQLQQQLQQQQQLPFDFYQKVQEFQSPNTQGILQPPTEMESEEPEVSVRQRANTIKERSDTVLSMNDQTNEGKEFNEYDSSEVSVRERATSFVESARVTPLDNIPPTMSRSNSIELYTYEEDRVDLPTSDTLWKNFDENEYAIDEVRSRSNTLISHHIIESSFVVENEDIVQNNMLEYHTKSITPEKRNTTVSRSSSTASSIVEEIVEERALIFTENSRHDTKGERPEIHVSVSRSASNASSIVEERIQAITETIPVIDASYKNKSGRSPMVLRSSREKNPHQTEYYMPEENGECLIKPSEFQVHRFADRGKKNTEVSENTEASGNAGKPAKVETAQIRVEANVDLDRKMSLSDLKRERNKQRLRQLQKFSSSEPLLFHKEEETKEEDGRPHFNANKISMDTLSKAKGKRKVEKWSNETYTTINVGKINIPDSFQDKPTDYITEREKKSDEHFKDRKHKRDHISQDINSSTTSSPRPSTPKKTRRFSLNSITSNKSSSRSEITTTTTAPSSPSSSQKSIGSRFKQLFSPRSKRKHKKSSKKEGEIDEDIVRRLNMNATTASTFSDDSTSNMSFSSQGDDQEDSFGFDDSFLSTEEWLQANDTINNNGGQKPVIKQSMMPINGYNNATPVSSWKIRKGIGRVTVPDVFADQHNHNMQTAKFNTQRSKKTLLAYDGKDEDNNKSHYCGDIITNGDIVINSFDVEN